MYRITPTCAHSLHDTAATRRIEQTASAALPPHTLMQRAGQAVGRLALALAPHADKIWIACGPGNNGGDGLEASVHLHRSGKKVFVTWLGHPEHTPKDAQQSWQRAKSAGVEFVDRPPANMEPSDLCIDAVLGVGLDTTAPQRPSRNLKPLLSQLEQLRRSPAKLLAIDLPSGLLADTGQYATGFTPPQRRSDRTRTSDLHTLSLLTLKPGLFTASGRDAAGTVWFDDLGVAPDREKACALLSAPQNPSLRPHDCHKGTFGDLAVVGGEGLPLRGMGMGGAALLAASAALHSGVGRVMVTLLDDGNLQLDVHQPELMLRRFEALQLTQLTVVCGCGGGNAVRRLLPEILLLAARLVLDADALNAIAEDAKLQKLITERSTRGQPTVITPHPLEAARLLGVSTAQVQSDRLETARQLTIRFNCVAVLKGSGTVIAAPGCTPHINPTGNALLATAGTGDVLAGMVGAGLARGLNAFDASSAAVFAHGLAADRWPKNRPLVASALLRRT